MSTQLIPGVAAHAYSHQVCGRSCRSYVTEGLRAHGQRELVMTIAKGDEPYQLLATIANLAQQGRIVDQAGFTEFGPSGLFGQPHIRGVVYQRAWPMAGVPLPDGALAMIALVDHEMATAKKYGPLRVLARLGRAHRFFPTMVWCDIERGAVFPPEANTVLESVALGNVGTVSIAIAGETVELRMPRTTQAMLANNLPPPDVALGFVTTIAPNADSCLVWSPGQTSPEAIALPNTNGACTSGCFVLFVPQQDVDEVNFFEDGFTCMLTDASWARLRQAFATGESLAIPGTRTLVLDWF